MAGDIQQVVELFASVGCKIRQGGCCHLEVTFPNGQILGINPASEYDCYVEFAITNGTEIDWRDYLADDSTDLPTNN